MSEFKTEAIFEDEAVREFLQNMDKRLSKIENGKKEFSALLSSIVFRDVMDHFEKEEGESGGWKSWSDSYNTHMQKIGMSGNKKLQFTGTLRQSFKPTNLRSTKNGITWFNNAKTSGGFPYAAAHDIGGPKLPKRDFMWLSDSGIEKVSQVTLAFLLEKGI